MKLNKNENLIINTKFGNEIRAGYKHIKSIKVKDIRFNAYYNCFDIEYEISAENTSFVPVLELIRIGLKQMYYGLDDFETYELNKKLLNMCFKVLFGKNEKSNNYLSNLEIYYLIREKQIENGYGTQGESGKANKVNSTSQFRDFERKLKDIAKYNEIIINDKYKLVFRYESGPYSFVNYCFIYADLYIGDNENEEWGESYKADWDYGQIGDFSIQNYNMTEALKKAKELINLGMKHYFPGVRTKILTRIEELD